MSNYIGSRLPDDLYRRLAAAERRPGRVVVVQTIDEQGWPHPALLSEFEVLALDPRRLRLAAGHGSKTAANIRDRHRVTLALIEPEAVYYLKLRKLTEKSPEGPSDLFELEVAAVLLDEAREEETGTRLVTGLHFTASQTAVSYHEQVFAALQAW